MVVALKEVSVEFAVELCFVSLPFLRNDHPELLPAFPLPALGLGREIRPVVVEVDPLVRA
jgi:hypothetical protein